MTRHYNDTLVVKTRTCRAVGVNKAGVISFKGIPYAKQPVGALRWHDPQPLDDSDEIFEAFRFGKTSIQSPWHTEEASYTLQGEDCLSLNIWTTELKPDKLKPVMVWIHGGAFVLGGSADPLYDGHNFIKRRNDIIYVSINYRLGLMGLIDLTRFGEEYKNSPNLALLDQIRALKWIKENIAKFGGDPENITIYGESAGAGSVSSLIVSEKAKGLFHKAIIQSDSFFFSNIQAPGCDLAVEITDKLLEYSGAKGIDDLMALTEEQIIELTDDITGVDLLNALTADGEYIPTDPWQAFEDNTGSTSVPIMLGTNSHEDNYEILEKGSYENFLNTLPGEWEEMSAGMTAESLAVVQQYFDSKPGLEEAEKIAAYWTEEERVRTNKIAEYHAKYAPTYLYYWAVPSSYEHVGACHAVEIAYTHYNLDEDIFTGGPIDPAIAARANDAWANFAKTGNPSTPEVEWPAFDLENRANMIFTPEKAYVENDFMKEDRILVEKNFSRY